MKNLSLYIILIAVTLLATGCLNSRRDEIEQRKAGLKRMQDSTLLASQQELAIVDSALEAVKAEYERMKAEVEARKSTLQATEEELTALTLLRMRRDSLQVQWDVLGAKIKYIKVKMKSEK
jgi:PBP1b-binding outer membrane lipoprotein LpoB